jgi:hypothetical protein
MAESSRDMLSLGVFLIIIVAAILLFAVGFVDWTLVVPVILVLSGFWMLVLAVMRGSKPQKYAPSAFGSMGIGLFLIAVGGAWYLFRFGVLYSVALVLLVLGALAIAAALRRK